MEPAKGVTMDAQGNRFLEGFSPPGRARLLAAMNYQDLESGEYLFREGDVADGVCLVLNGEVEIVKTAENREKILGAFAAGDYLGEVAVLDGFGRSTDARARGKAMVATIPTATLLEVLGTEPVSLTLGLFQNVLFHLRRTNEAFVREVVHKEKLSLVGEMASSLMHDLRNPIAGVHLAADLITMTHTDPETVHCCNNIRLQCDRVVAMAGELLEFSRGETRLDLGPSDAAEFVHKFAKLNDDYFKKTGVQFEILSESSPIEIDSMRLMRLLQNLITNAVDAIGKKPNGRIVIDGRVADGIFHLTLADNGPGIPEAIRETIFEPFVTHGKKNGTGLGMAIAKNVVGAHGGTIDFETETGRGTTFFVKLPQFGPRVA